MEKMTDRVNALKAAAESAMAEGSDLRPFLGMMLELMGSMAEQIDTLTEDLAELDDYVETLDDDLADLETAMFDDEAEDEDEADDEEDEEEDNIRFLSDGDLIRYACPSCGHPITFRAADIDLEEEFLCPDCGKPVFPEVEDDETDQ